ncbi:MAG: thermonuclease family protein [Paracoccaceae bacterium]
MLRCCSLLVLLLLPLSAFADVVGRVTVIDGDTLRVGSTKIRLHGIDAPELDQTCRTPERTEFACGIWVRDHLKAKFANRKARCVAIDTDRYGRVVAKCRVRGVDMGGWLVSEGLAFAYRQYSLDYDLDEKRAFTRVRGLHQFSVQGPDEFRKAKATQRAGASPKSKCSIKGNISSNGRIYHMPGQEYYDKTTIRPGKGERWFCSEAEARQAGWRKARR